LYIDIKRYKPGTTHEEIMRDWMINDELDLWRLLYTHTQIEIRKVEDGWLSLGVNTESSIDD